MTKEEIFHKNARLTKDLDFPSDWTTESIYAAMDEYARQEAIEFAVWVDTNGCQYMKNEDKWFCLALEPDFQTTEQLYNLYLQSKKP